MSSPSHEASLNERIIQRILDRLEADQHLKAEVREFRFGELGTGPKNNIAADQYPAIYVTSAPAPEVERKAMGPGTQNALQTQLLTLEFHVYVIARGPTPDEAQKNTYRITQAAFDILAHNVQLRDSEENNPLAHGSDIFTQRVLVEQKGDILQGMVIRVRPTLVADHGDISFIASPE